MGTGSFVATVEENWRKYNKTAEKSIISGQKSGENINKSDY